MDPIRALIDFSDPRQPNGPRLRHAFAAPRQHLVAHTLAEVQPVLAAVQAAAEQGQWCVGYLRYEAAPAFDAALQVHQPDGPLASFMVFDAALPWPEGVGTTAADTTRIDWQSFLPRSAFDQSMDMLLQAIGNGELYQVNYTAAMFGHFSGQPLALFDALQKAQPGGYAMALDHGEHHVLSVSPELFFDWRGGELLARPMKGTAPRSDDAKEDAALAAHLRESPKERAENVMIVDLLRNDMSRVAQPFSVTVPKLFQTEALPTVWQMTSDVAAHTRPGCTLVDVFAALFPCGSVTGAPKVQAMRMIHELEPAPRGVYCGALGVVRPDGPGGFRATFNVPIRTVSLQGDTARCGIGSGITADATAEGEWREWQNKQAFVQRASASFALLETLALVDGALRNGQAHLARLAAAAAHFGRPFNDAQVRQALQAVHRVEGAWRIRLLLDAQGHATAEAFALEASPAEVKLQLADRPLIEAHTEFVRFKTTRRAHYDAFAPTQPGAFDTLLWNPEGEITECTRGNIALLLDGRWVTPPLHCGLLGGVGRAQALLEGRVVEAVVTLQDLPRVQALAFVNSLRGWITAELLPA
ncbi:aminodeoxychorismate synthase component I [Variovorax sp. HJSM1_2]|uniref:aminodeoxychorismate synthase component I n=1 Tax=Variovorax sp. HJSM1_2 TaxID=3366263 RepID=UPI003BEC4B16